MFYFTMIIVKNLKNRICFGIMLENGNYYWTWKMKLFSFTQVTMRRQRLEAKVTL